MEIKNLINICKECEHHNPQDKMYYMAWWSHCQTKCKLLKLAKEVK
jgi:hypothetical protein